jgi:RNA polymerase-binding transcription factor
MGLTAAQKRTLHRALEALVSDVSSRGPRRIAPNRTDQAQAGSDEDEQPLNEMLQAIASNRNRASGAALERAQRALDRLDRAPEEAGTCEECGEDIPWARLRAMPDAELCVGCQGKRDGPGGGPTRRGLTDLR